MAEDCGSGANRWESLWDADRRDSISVANVGRIEYGAAVSLQRRLVELRDADRIGDVMLFVEHDPVFTLGRRGSRGDIYANEEELERHGIRVHETNRGGLVTYHGPGQLVGYPVVRLRSFAGDAPRYVCGLEKVLISTLAEFGIRGWQHPEHRGVFTDQGKIAAIGVAVSHGVTMHGFALNVQPNLEHYQLINPCGIGSLGVTSMARVTGQEVSLDDARAAVSFHVGRAFGCVVDEIAWPALAKTFQEAEAASAA